MNIVGLQKLTLLDYPGHVACTVFLQGCNFKCPFCYNSSLIKSDTDNIISLDEFFAFINSRKKILDGVAITGGEPLLNCEIKEFIKQIKELNLLVKLDTNGSNPSLLKELLEANLLDYVAMDIKNSYEKYPITCGVDVNLEDIQESISILMNSSIDYEFRTTVVKEFHDIEDFHKIGQMIKGAKNYYLQSYQNNRSWHSIYQQDMLICLAI
jgi:pyruvate formate lyase activating enzyme